MPAHLDQADLAVLRAGVAADALIGVLPNWSTSTGDQPCMICGRLKTVLSMTTSAKRSGPTSAT